MTTKNFLSDRLVECLVFPAPGLNTSWVGIKFTDETVSCVIDIDHLPVV